MRLPALLLLLLAGPALAQAPSPAQAPAPAQTPAAKGKVLDPPRGPVAQAYLARVGSRVSTQARYLSADAPIDLKRSTLREGALIRGRDAPDGTGRVLGWAMIVLIGAALIYALLQARYGEMFARGQPERKAEPTTVELADIGTADISGLSVEKLLRMDDPREALRLLLIHALSRAAEANGIALRRSFTARDVLARVPGSWNLRRLLEAIVRRGEVVLFGGRPFGRDDLASVLEAAEPMFRGGRR